jgi:hypothetical protein
MTFFKLKSFTSSWKLTVLGVTLSRGVHNEEPAPAPSGAHLAIYSSFWISTRRRAFGFGTVRDLARLMSIEVQPAGGGRFATESGSMRIEPPIALARGAQSFEVWITNHAPVVAEVILSVRIGEHWKTNAHSIEPGAMKRSEFFNSEMSGTADAELIRLATPPPCVDWIQYETEPSGAPRSERIHGRPEFGDENSR